MPVIYFILNGPKMFRLRRILFICVYFNGPNNIYTNIIRQEQ